MNWFTQLFSRRRRYDDISASIEEHIAERTDEQMAEGMSRKQAEQAARREFGNVALISQHSREAWQWPRFESLLADVRFAFRQLSKSPGFTITTVLTLGLGIGAVTAIFTVVDGVLLQPLPYAHPERIMEISSQYAGGADYRVTRAAQFRFMQQHNRSFEGLAVADPAPSGVTLSGSGDPEHVSAQFISADFFRVLGITPALGRDFTPNEDRPGTACVAIITDGLFQSRFNNDLSLLHQKSIVNGQSCSIVGVLPAGFRSQFDAGIFMPARIADAPTDLGHYYQLLARVNPGVTKSQERAELQTIFFQFKTAHGDLVDDGEVGFQTEPYQAIMIGNVATALSVLLAAVFLLLLITCVNVAHLQLTRASARSKELAVRAALGARRSRLVRQLITEHAILALVGGACGIALSFFAVPALLNLAPGSIPRVDAISLNFEVVAFAFVVSAFTVLVSGLAPALKATRLDLVTALKARSQTSSAGSARGLARGLLIATEVSLSLVLLTGAVLLMRSFIGLERVDPGFDPKNVLAFKMSLPPKYATTAKTWEFEREVLARLAALPGVDAAASATSLPTETGPDMPGEVAGQIPPLVINPAYRAVSPDYFHVLGIPLILGRSFTGADSASSTPIAIVNATLAREAFKGRDAIGQRLRLGAALGPDYLDSTRVIVGVADDVREASLIAEPSPTVFIPRAQIPNALTPLMNKVLPISWALHTITPPAQLADSIRSAIASVDPQQAIADLRSMDQALSATLDRQRFTLLLMAIFALLALIMASVGIFGVVSYHVQLRERELGVRLALGAAPRSLVQMAVLQGIMPIAAGILVGAGASLLLARLIRSLLFETSPNDPGSLAISAGILAMVAVIGAYLPARRAASVNPVEVLRAE